MTVAAARRPSPEVPARAARTSPPAPHRGGRRSRVRGPESGPARLGAHSLSGPVSRPGQWRTRATAPSASPFGTGAHCPRGRAGPAVRRTPGIPAAALKRCPRAGPNRPRTVRASSPLVSLLGLLFWKILFYLWQARGSLIHRIPTLSSSSLRRKKRKEKKKSDRVMFSIAMVKGSRLWPNLSNMLQWKRKPLVSASTFRKGFSWLYPHI